MTLAFSGSARANIIPPPALARPSTWNELFHPAPEPPRLLQYRSAFRHGEPTWELLHEDCGRRQPAPALPIRPRLRMHHDNRDPPSRSTPDIQWQALPKMIIRGDASVP